MKKALILDMDGLMVDSERLTFQGYIEEFKKYNIDFPVEKYKTFLGRTIPVIYGLIRDYYGQDIPSEDIVKNVHKYLETSFETNGVPVKEGLFELLKYAKEHNIQCAVATSSSRVRAMGMLEKAGVLSYFDEIVCGDEIKVGKPNPEIFLTAAKKLNVDVKDAYVLEDAESGIEAGYNGGFEVICIPDMKYPEDAYAAKATMILDTLSDVVRFIDGQIHNDFDLHMHSCHSTDGQFTCRELIEIAKERGMKTIALADHDSIAGVKDIIEIGKQEGIYVIPATELYTEFHENDVHLLGYDIDLDYPYFVELPAKSKIKFRQDIQKKIDLFKIHFGIEVDEEAILNSQNAWFELMTTILNHPVYSKMEIFKDYVPGGRRGNPGPVNFYWDKCQKGSKLYVESTSPSLKSSIDEIHKAGGLAIIAHPFNLFYHNEEYLQEAIEMGIDGIEAYSNYHTPEMNAYYERMAKKYNLLMTCGSDFHGEKKPSIKMGEYGLNKDGSSIIKNFLREIQMRKVKLVICDIDGTLYNWTRILSPKTIQAINDLHAKGIKFGLASGRPYEELVHYAKEWKFDFPFDVIVGQNGVELYDLEQDKLYNYYMLQPDTLTEICKLMESFDCAPFMYWHQKLLYAPCDEKFNDFLEISSKTSKREIVRGDITKLCEEPNAKIMFRMFEDEVKKVEAYLEEHPHPIYTGLKTQSTLIEFMDRRVSKGLALDKLVEMTDYGLENIVAFGDTTNDNAMLEKAGWGVCLLNGSDDTKALADDITETGCSEDGFANYIYKYLLK